MYQSQTIPMHIFLEQVYKLSLIKLKNIENLNYKEKELEKSKLFNVFEQLFQSCQSAELANIYLEIMSLLALAEYEKIRKIISKLVSHL